jgi:chromate transporter
VLPAPHFKRLAANTPLRAFVDGVTAAATGAIAGAAYVLATRALVDLWTAAMAVATFAVLARFKISELWLIGAAGALGLAVKAGG